MYSIWINYSDAKKKFQEMEEIEKIVVFKSYANEGDKTNTHQKLPATIDHIYSRQNLNNIPDLGHTKSGLTRSVLSYSFFHLSNIIHIQFIN